MLITTRLGYARRGSSARRDASAAEGGPIGSLPTMVGQTMGVRLATLVDPGEKHALDHGAAP